jgi:hypothetical protein
VIRINEAVLKKRNTDSRRACWQRGRSVIFFDAADNIPYGQTVEVMVILAVR